MLIAVLIAVLNAALTAMVAMAMVALRELTAPGSCSTGRAALRPLRANPESFGRNPPLSDARRLRR